jgi:hypothetical protein
MPNNIRIAGVSGSLKVGYQQAARLRSWVLEHSVVRGTADIDAFWIDEESSKSLVLDLGKVQWVWRDVEVLEKGPQLAVRVNGKPEVRR